MYSVFIDKRPIRFAFLVNPQDEKWPEQLDAIGEYSLDKWRGRFNLVVPTNGEIIDSEWWEFLRKIDPDYVISTTVISDTLRERINAEIHPIDVEVPRPNQQPDERPRIFTYNDTIRVIPDSNTLPKTSRIPFPLPPSPILANFQPGWTSEVEVKRFVIRNFGSYPNIVYWNNVLDDIAHVNFHVDTKGDLVKALTELSRPEAKAVYPIQVSSLDGPRFYVDYQHEHSYDVFGLIVGDTYEEQVFSWNKVFFGSTVNQSHRLNHLWIPCSFASDLEFMATLGDWLRRMSENVHLFSFSISEDELSTISDSLDPPPPDGRLVFKGNLYRTVTSYQKMQFPKFTTDHAFSFWQGYSPPLEPPKLASHFRAYGPKEELELTIPMLKELRPGTGHWMAEVFIESDDGRFRTQGYSSPGSTFWWRLPRKNYLATWIFKEKSRIASNGIPAVQLPAKDPRLRFDLPDDIDLLRMCVLGDVYGRMAGHVSRTTPSIDQVELSNNGQYLNGFISVFGGLASAHGILSERYWRTMLDQLAGKDLTKSQRIRDKVRGKLRKRIKPGLTASEIIQNFENLAEYIIQLSREVGLEGQSRRFADFEEDARADHEAFKQEHSVDWEFSERGVKEELSRMLRTGLLWMGFDQKCPRCGSINWFVIDDARQEAICDGCRFRYSIPAEPTISYRLSSLARHGISSHGLVPVVLVLGQLLREANSSFFFSPCLDLLRLLSEEPRQYERLTDLDIVCIKDGKFVIGEVKSNQARFELESCLALAKIAKAIQADVLLFSSLDDHQTRQTEELISKVRDELIDSNVDVGWYQLGQEIFEASRMDY
jgi:hypothetical protein